MNIKPISRYLWKTLISAPIISVTVIDIILFLIALFGLNIILPSWLYWIILIFGLLVSNYRMIRKFEVLQTENNLNIDLFRYGSQEKGDAISYSFQGLDFQPKFGINITSIKPSSIYKGIFGTFTFSWRGNQPEEKITIIVPDEDMRWQIINKEITYNEPASFSLNAKDDIVTNNQPLILPNLRFHVHGAVQGYLLINYSITSVEPSTTKLGEVVINIKTGLS
jgi:hypothetical protein